MTKQILVAIDDSDPAASALEHALERFPDASITVLHVIEVDEPDGSLRQRAFPSEYEQQRRAAEETAETVLEDARTYADEQGKPITTATRYGNPVRRITEYAEENDIDRVVIGTHDRSGISRLLLGSLSELVARRSSVPVTTVPERTDTEPFATRAEREDPIADVAERPSPTFRRCPGCGVTLHTRLEFCPGCLGVTLPTGRTPT